MSPRLRRVAFLLLPLTVLLVVASFQFGDDASDFAPLPASPSPPPPRTRPLVADLTGAPAAPPLPTSFSSSAYSAPRSSPPSAADADAADAADAAASSGDGLHHLFSERGSTLRLAGRHDVPMFAVPSSTLGAGRNFPHTRRVVSIYGGCLVVVGAKFFEVRPLLAKLKDNAAGAHTTGGCARACRALEGCTAYTFGYRGNRCTLYAAQATLVDGVAGLAARGGVRAAAASPAAGSSSSSTELLEVDEHFDSGVCDPAAPAAAFVEAAAASDEPPFDPSLATAGGPLPYLCRPNVSDHAAWRQRVGAIPAAYAPAARFQPQLPEALLPTWYCDKLANPTTPYALPQKGSGPEGAAAAFVVGLYSGESLLYTRASACADTWLTGLPEENKFVFTAVDEKAAYGLPDNSMAGLNVPLGRFDPASLTLERERSNAQRLQLHGLYAMYTANKEKDWFVIVGDDTYIDVDFMTRGLERYDPAEPLWLAPYGYREVEGRSDGWKWILRTPRHRDFLANLSADADYYEAGARTASQWTQRHAPLASESTLGRPPRVFEWTTGATAWVLSRTAAKLFAENLSTFLKTFDVDAVCYCPDLLTGLMLSLLGLRITSFPHLSMHPYAVDSKDVDFSKVDEVALYHYVQPARMVSLHQRAVHAKIDRLLAHGRLSRVAEYAAQLGAQHQEARARRSSQVFQMYRVLHASAGSDDAVRARSDRHFPEPPLSPPVVPAAGGTAPERAQYVRGLRAFVDRHFEELRRWQSLVASSAARLKKHSVAMYDIPAAVAEADDSGAQR
eukprot:Rhum_TRINITY_DN7243_c0_g1::Rhum_TRINITY_DN7243_c0_g1_i1::g.22273::m.22273